MSSRNATAAPVTNATIASALDEIADLLELQGANPFRVRAYRTAARTVTDLGPSVSELLASGEQMEGRRGIGKDLAGKIADIATRGSCAQLDSLRGQVPPAMLALLRLPGIGPHRAQELRNVLHIDTVEQLQEAAAQGRVAEVRGFGARLQQQILDACRERQARTPTRTRLADAQPLAAAMLDDLRKVTGVQRAEAAGSLRRCRETVGDLDLLVVAAAESPVVEHFCAHRGVRTVLARGGTRASVVLRGGLQVDLRVVRAPSFGAAWMYFTGSKAHNIALRRIAQDMDLKLNEYGLYRGTRRIAGRSETGVYAALGLPWIAPELREDRGEIEAARTGSLPVLVERDDLRGDLHVHTADGLGRDSLEAMAQAARARGLEYLAITDHLDAERLARQADCIDAFNASRAGVTLLKGVEVDIREDGALALPDAVLARVDVVVGVVAGGLDQPRARMTDRLRRAMDHPRFTLLAHPTGRVVNERDPADIDLRQVLRHARERGCFVELNAQPARLDLDDVGCRMAREEGVPVAVTSDARSAAEVGLLSLGIGQARRGWLRAGDVLNTRALHALLPLLGARAVDTVAAQ